MERESAMAKMAGRSVLTLLALAALVAAPAAADVLGQVALNEVKVDGALVPTGTTVMSPSLVETGSYPGSVHLSTGQTVNLAANSSAYLQAGSEGGVELSARSGQVQVGGLDGETFQLAMNTVALLEDEEPSLGSPVAKIKMCRGDGDPVMVALDDAEIQAKIDLGWGVAGVDPYDADCNKKAGAGFVWTKGKVAALVGGTLVLGYVIGEEGDKTVTQEVQCQSPDASPVVPGLPFCGT